MTPKTSRILGLDPGVARLGWAVVESVGQDTNLIDAGLLTTPSKQPMPARLMKQAKELRALIKKYKPQAISLEQVFFTTNVSTALITSQVRGVLLLIAAEHTLPISEFTPTAIKLAVTGDGRADKQQIHHMVKLLLRLKHAPSNDDTTDAMAVALCGLSTRTYA